MNLIILLSTLAVLALAVSTTLPSHLTIPNAVSTLPSHALFTSSSTAFDGPKVFPINSSTYDWWYFDVVSHDAQSACTVVFIAGPESAFPVGGQDNGSTHVQITLTSPGVSEVYKSIHFVAQEAIVSTHGDGASGNWNGTGFSFAGAPDLGAYRVNIAAPAYGIKGTLQFKSLSPPHLPCNPKVGQAPMQIVEGVGWANAVPSASTVVSLSINGTAHDFLGLGYHDKNWGDRPFATTVQSWFWGHGSVGEYTIVWFSALSRTGVHTVSAYLTPTSFSNTGTIPYSTCSPSKLIVLPSDGPYPPTNGTSSGAFDISFYPDGPGKKEKQFRVHVTPVRVLISAGTFYARWSGSLVGGWVGGRNQTGPALYEEFAFPI
ncbi:hypothetical protein RQP46_005673 [Phenoliferia psychrophenolica]